MRTYSCRCALFALVCTDIEDGIAESEARAEAHRPEIEQHAKLVIQVAEMRSKREQVEADAQLSKKKLELARLVLQQKVLEPAITIADQTQLEIRKRLLVMPLLLPAAAAVAPAPTFPAAAATASSSIAATAAAFTPAIPHRSRHSKRKDRDDELPSGQSSSISSSQSSTDAEDGRQVRKKKRQGGKSKRHHSASPKVKLEAGLENSAYGASQTAAPASAASITVEERSPVPGDFGTDEDLLAYIQQPNPAAARAAAAAASARSSKPGKKHKKHSKR